MPQGTQGADTASDTNDTNQCVNNAMCMIDEESPKGPEGPKFSTAINTEGTEGPKFSIKKTAPVAVVMGGRF